MLDVRAVKTGLRSDRLQWSVKPNDDDSENNSK